MKTSFRSSSLLLILLVFCSLSIATLGCSITGLLNPEPQPTSEDLPDVQLPESLEGESPIPTNTKTIEVTPLPITEVSETSPQPTALPEIPTDIVSQMDEIESQVIELRELQPTRFVSRSLLTREQLRQKVEDEFFEDYTAEEARDDVIVLSAFGLVQPGFDMFNFYQDLLSEQIAGQYDDETEVMEIIGGSEFSDTESNNNTHENTDDLEVKQEIRFSGTERLTYAHEYTHALQDQNYDIENGLGYNNEACEEDSERCAAVQALLEGDASLLEFMWIFNYATAQDIQDIQEFYSTFDGPIYDSAPDYLKEDFLFPYLYGQTFVEYLYNLGGWEAINKAYNNLPISTEQILHPERYPADKPIQVNLPDLTPIFGEGWRELEKDVLGEWYTYLVLAHGLVPDARLSKTEAQAASDGWGGDVFVVYHNEEKNQVVLVLHTNWETTSDANQFFKAFQKHSTSRFGPPTITNQEFTGWYHDHGYTEIHKQDRFTTWILTPDQSLAQQIWETIRGG